MLTFEEIRARREADLHELELRLERAKGMQSTGSMSWRRDGVSSPPVDTKSYLVGTYERLVREQRSILAHMDDMI